MQWRRDRRAKVRRQIWGCPKIVENIFVGKLAPQMQNLELKTLCWGNLKTKFKY